MSDKELRRSEVLSRVQRGELKLSEAAELLAVSYRQSKRLWSRYRRAGPAGLKHGNVGRRSNRAKPVEFRARVVGLVREHYSGGPGERFGPTLVGEHLAADHGMAVSVRTLRRWMLAEGLWSRSRKREIAKPQPKARPKTALERRPPPPHKSAADHPWRRALLPRKRAANSGRLWK